MVTLAVATARTVALGPVAVAPEVMTTMTEATLAPVTRGDTERASRCPTVAHWWWVINSNDVSGCSQHWPRTVSCVL